MVCLEWGHVVKDFPAGRALAEPIVFPELFSHGVVNPVCDERFFTFGTVVFFLF